MYIVQLIRILETSKLSLNKQQDSDSANLCLHQKWSGIAIWIARLLQIRMSAKSVPECCGCISLSASVFLSASLYVSKRGAYWDRLCRDVVGWSVGCHARALWPNGASYAYSYYGTLIGNPTPGIQWYNFRPPGVTPNRGMAPREAIFVKLLWPLVVLMQFGLWRAAAFISSPIHLFKMP